MLLIAGAGAVGAVLRVWLDAFLTQRFPVRWPVGTAVVNVLGSLLLGIVTGLVGSGRIAEPTRLAVAVGFCGAFTTFSTAALETLALRRQGHGLGAVAYAVGGLASCLAAAGLGLALV